MFYYFKWSVETLFPFRSLYCLHFFKKTTLSSISSTYICFNHQMEFKKLLRKIVYLPLFLFILMFFLILSSKPSSPSIFFLFREPPQPFFKDKVFVFAWFLVTILSLPLSENFSNLSSFLKDIFAWCKILSWLYFSFNTKYFLSFLSGFLGFR